MATFGHAASVKKLCGPVFRDHVDGGGFYVYDMYIGRRHRVPTFEAGAGSKLYSDPNPLSQPILITGW